MKLRFFFSIPPLLCAMGAQAENSQSVLAHQIENESETTEIVVEGVLSVRKYLLISDCDVTAVAQWLTEESGPREERVYRLTFDLARTQLPEITDEASEQWGVIQFSELGRLGVVRFDFSPGYESAPYGYIPPGWSASPVQGYNFFMEEMTDVDQPQRLLRLMSRYQAAYCTFSE